MTYYLQQALNIALIAFAIGQVMVLIGIVFVFGRHIRYEILLRVLAVVCGILIYCVARALRLPILDLILNDMQHLPEEYGIYLEKLAIPVAVLFSLIVGFVLSSSVSRYIINHARIESAGDRAINTRLMCLFITLILLLYCDLYMSFGIEGDENIHQLKPLLPNLMFILSVLLFVIFRFRPSKTAAIIPVGPPDKENRPTIPAGPPKGSGAL